MSDGLFGIVQLNVLLELENGKKGFQGLESTTITTMFICIHAFILFKKISKMLFVSVPPTHGIWLQMSLMNVITMCVFFSLLL